MVCGLCGALQGCRPGGHGGPAAPDLAHGRHPGLQLLPDYLALGRRQGLVPALLEGRE